MRKIWMADWSCNKKEIFMLPFMMTVLGIMGILIVLLALFFDNAEDYVLMGTLMALISAFLFMPACFAAKYSNWWRLSGSMGVTRKTFFFYMLLRQLGTMIISYALLLVLWQAEQRLYGSLFPALPNLTDLTDLLRFPVAAAIISAAVTLQLLFGALAVQFGTKGIGIPQVILTALFWLTAVSEDFRARVLEVQDQTWLILSVFAFAAAVLAIYTLNPRMTVK